ncbi:hypothetical protein HHK36_028584 [Tetracentron sinense]|uniref:ATP synthase F1 complex delta/epsilon subunit N-terminal domain-containing protein n=1 Tax=Tetracentron sinense TaxID=13715 RepID=A0A834YHM4_TETSI|nr:hypothetical protein HHK36_028584 [Tetracentron sinense]
MFRQAPRLLVRASAMIRARPFATDLPVTPTADSTFVDAWRKVIPHIEPPKTPLSFMKPRPPTPSSIPTKITVNFVLPYASELSTKEGSFQKNLFSHELDVMLNTIVVCFVSCSKNIKLEQSCICAQSMFENVKCGQFLYVLFRVVGLLDLLSQEQYAFVAECCNDVEDSLAKVGVYGGDILFNGVDFVYVCKDNERILLLVVSKGFMSSLPLFVTLFSLYVMLLLTEGQKISLPLVARHDHQLKFRSLLSQSLADVPLVDMVIIPATTGQMGVLPGHVATIAELKPGILSVHEGNEVSKYFISSGFAFIHANSFADIVAVEAVPVDHIDPNLVQKGLAEFTQKLSSASTDLEKAEAQIGVEIHSALNFALTG